jgi:hypothetical protein
MAVSNVARAPRPCLSAPTTGEAPVLRSAARPLRIGYVSPDLREHPVAYFIEPILAPHNSRSTGAPPVMNSQSNLRGAHATF